MLTTVCYAQAPPKHRFQPGQAVYHESETVNGRKRVRYICFCEKREHGKVWYKLKDKPPSDGSRKPVEIKGGEWVPEVDIGRVPKHAEILPDGTVVIEE